MIKELANKKVKKKILLVFKQETRFIIERELEYFSMGYKRESKVLNLFAKKIMFELGLYNMKRKNDKGSGR